MTELAMSNARVRHHIMIKPFELSNIVNKT